MLQKFDCLQLRLGARIEHFFVTMLGNSELDWEFRTKLKICSVSVCLNVILRLSPFYQHILMTLKWCTITLISYAIIHLN